MRCLLASAIALLLLGPCIQAHLDSIPDEGPIILIYAGSMKEWGDALGEVLISDPRIEASCVVVNEKGLFSLLLFLPRTEAAIIAPMTSTDVGRLSDVVAGFFEQGGAVAGFSPCTDIRKEPEMASTIFPLFCNQSKGSERFGPSLVNTYVERETMGDVGSGLPTTFRLVSSGYLYATDPSGAPLEPDLAVGSRSVFYEENITGAPLVVGYCRERSGRSVAFSGCRVNDIPRSNVYFGHLVNQSEFRLLLGDAMSWALKGSSRYADHLNTWRESLAEEGARREDAARRAREMEGRANVTRAVILVVVWAVTLSVSFFATRGLILGRG